MANDSRVQVLFGNPEMKPGASTPEGAASEYFHNRVSMGSWTVRPPTHRWAKDQRERFEKELARLEAQRSRQQAEAVEQAVNRPVIAVVRQGT
jgi:hypothetical protein